MHTRFRADAEERNYPGDPAARRVLLLRACILIIHARRRAFYRGIIFRWPGPKESTRAAGALDAHVKLCGMHNCAQWNLRLCRASESFLALPPPSPFSLIPPVFCRYPLSYQTLVAALYYIAGYVLVTRYARLNHAELRNRLNDKLRDKPMEITHSEIFLLRLPVSRTDARV